MKTKLTFCISFKLKTLNHFISNFICLRSSSPSACSIQKLSHMCSLAFPINTGMWQFYCLPSQLAEQNPSSSSTPNGQGPDRLILFDPKHFCPPPKEQRHRVLRSILAAGNVPACLPAGRRNGLPCTPSPSLEKTHHQPQKGGKMAGALLQEKGGRNKLAVHGQ